MVLLGLIQGLIRNDRMVGYLAESVDRSGLVATAAQDSVAELQIRRRLLNAIRMRISFRASRREPQIRGRKQCRSVRK